MTFAQSSIGFCCRICATRFLIDRPCDSDYVRRTNESELGNSLKFPLWVDANEKYRIETQLITRFLTETELSRNLIRFTI